MGHALRNEEPGMTYHVTSRGNDRQQTFFDDFDFEAALAILERVARRYEWVVLAYCLMTNHLHLVVRLDEGGLSTGMRELVGGYSMRTNKRHGRSGHLFQNRFSSKLVETDSHLQGALRYVVLNPVRAGICDTAERYPWSSYRACAGLEFGRPFLALREVLGLFGRDPAEAVREYRTFVRAGQVLVSDTVTEV